jgi:UDP-hydrolysing UDP-N-acetyl-D-glucosamine 2-epimerase
LKVAVIVTARPSWAKLEPVCRALQARPDVELQLIVCASALLERYGKVVDVVTAQGYPVAAECWSTYEGATLLTSAAETGALLTALASTLSRLSPDAVVVCADRHEVLAAAQAASYLHVPLLHLQGGERSGSLDDKVRDSITQLSDQHCVSTERARCRVYGLTGDWSAIYLTGCPSIDLAREALDTPKVTFAEIGGVGYTFDLTERFLVILQHSVTSEVDEAAAQMLTTLDATRGVRRIVFWPGEDAGQERMAKVLRMTPDVHTVRNLPPQRFLRLLTQAACLVGNSSAGIREGSYLGVPVVNVGSRQRGRERGPNVIDVGHDQDAIRAAVARQIDHGHYPRATLYGKGDSGERIAQVICEGSCVRAVRSSPAGPTLLGSRSKG